MSSSPPVVGGRNLFSNVTRLGFAAGHDSPSLNIQETGGLQNQNVSADSSSTTGSILLIVFDFDLSCSPKYVIIYSIYDQNMDLLQCLKTFLFFSFFSLYCYAPQV